MLVLIRGECSFHSFLFFGFFFFFRSHLNLIEKNFKARYHYHVDIFYTA